MGKYIKRLNTKLLITVLEARMMYYDRLCFFSKLHSQKNDVFLCPSFVELVDSVRHFNGVKY